MADEALLTTAQLSTVGRTRSVCTAAGVAGAVTSMAANMLASDGSAVGLAVGVIAPGAFILASEIASTASSLPRTPGTRPLLVALVVLLIVIGVSAAVVSFGHIREVVASVGESPTAEVLIAIVVDAVAVMGLVGHRLTGRYLHQHQAATETRRQADQAAAIAARAEAERQAEAKTRRAERQATQPTGRPSRASRSGTPAARPAGPVAGDDPALSAPERARAIAAANPQLTRAEIASVIGKGERTVRRYLAEATPAEPESSDQNDVGPGGPGLVVVS